jgi:hypothetical protein
MPQRSAEINEWPHMTQSDIRFQERRYFPNIHVRTEVSNVAEGIKRTRRGKTGALV